MHIAPHVCGMEKSKLFLLIYSVPILNHMLPMLDRGSSSRGRGPTKMVLEMGLCLYPPLRPIRFEIWDVCKL